MIRVWRKLRLVLALDSSSIAILAEAYIYLIWARVLMWQPFAKLAPSLGLPMQETSTLRRKSDQPVLRRASHAIAIMSKYTVWESTCLIRAIAAMKMLERRKVGSTLYLGTAKDPEGNLIAHAWLRSGSTVITGGEVMQDYTIVGKFAKEMSGA
jgi:hypothetical protein